MTFPKKNTSSPDLELRVRTRASSSGTQLLYQLHSPTTVAPFANQEVAGPIFRGTPKELFPRLLRQIERLGDGYDVDGGLVLSPQGQRKLEGLGRELWRELFGNEMRLAYREFRDSVRSLLIYSDEPWIPWELIKPYDDQGELIDDDFFAAKFELTRWLPGNRVPAGEIQMEAFACLTSDVAGLPKIEAEGDLIRRLFGFQAQLRDASPYEPSIDALIRTLQKGGIGLFHLAGHGTFNPSSPNNAGFPLADGSVFRASDLHGAVQTQISKDRPLVFLNACRSGRQAWSLTSLGGWANRWVRDCGCGAFLSPQWNVRDSMAFAFAQAFYEALTLGETLGSAAKAARETARKTAPADPGWLAYAVYGHPNARIVLQVTSAETPPTLGRLIEPETFRIVETTSRSEPTDGQTGPGESEGEPTVHIARLLEGVPRWNEWRAANPGVIPSLAGAKLSNLDLSRANLTRANLTNANLSSASLFLADLTGAVLAGANLSGAMLRKANFTGADLSRVNLYSAVFGETVLVGTTLLGAKQLESTFHFPKSYVDHRTISNSPDLPLHFLRGCGLTDSEIALYAEKLKN